MRLGLFDLVIAWLIMSPVAYIGLGVIQLDQMLRSESIGMLVTAALMVLVYVVLSPPIYRWFHLKPLCFPRCPHCQHKDRFYYAPKAQAEWPVGKIICANCGSVLELWYDKPSREPSARGVVRFKLLWPQSIGRWRRVTAEDWRSEI